jgi:hypothetical protein
MKENMWSLNIEEQLSIMPPEEIVKNQCDFLREITKGKVVAEVAVYDGPTRSYVDHGLGGILRGFETSYKGREINIQENLGDIGENKCSFEFFTTSVNTPNYKFRVMFLSYGLSFYPVEIVLDEDIAEEIKLNPIIVCENESGLAEALKEIIESPKIEKVVQSLYAKALRDELRLQAVSA